MVSSNPIDKSTKLPRVGRAATALVCRTRASGGVGLDLADRFRRGGTDLDLARLHGFGNLAHQFDHQQAVLETRALDLDMVGECELPFERSCRDTAIQEVPPFPFSLAALEREHVLLGRQRDFIRAEAGQRHRNPEAVLVHAFDIVEGIVIFGGLLNFVEGIEQTIETDGRSPQRSPIIPHSQILQRARWYERTPDTRTGARLNRGALAGHPGRLAAAEKKLENGEKVS